jgi:hypothetical protein
MPGGAAVVAAAAKKKAAKGDSPKKERKERVERVPDAPPAPPPTGWRKYQPAAEWLYCHIYVQVTVAGLIGLNFLVNIVQAQIDPRGTLYVPEFEVFEWFFNIAFLIELVLNMYATWCCRFWKSGWNVFDFFVVVIGWAFQLQVPLPGPMKLLRMMRAFRVFRLFKRIASLRKVLNSLFKAIPGVMNAFLIQLIVMCIYAIIGVDRFQHYGAEGHFTNPWGVETPWASGRQQDYGFEYFGNFGKSLYTMFQVLTGESWSEVVARPLFHSNSPTTSTGAAFFFVSFMILNGVVLINVVVAVLLEKMVDEDPPPEEEEGDYEDEEEEEEEEKIDPLQANVESAKLEVVELKQQMDSIIEVSARMQRQLAEVGNVKLALSALLAQNGIHVPDRPQPASFSPKGLASTALGDDSSPQPPGMDTVPFGVASAPLQAPGSSDVTAPPP